MANQMNQRWYPGVCNRCMLETNQIAWRIARWTLGLSMATSLVLAFPLPHAAAQDPFGDSDLPDSGDDPLGDDSPATAKPTSSTSKPLVAGALPPTSHPVVREYRENRPKTPEEYARAFLYLSRLKEWKDLGYHLDAFGAKKIDQATAASMVKEIGHDRWLTIQWNMDELSDSQRAIVAQILDKAASALRDNGLLQRHYEGLQGKDAALVKKGLLGIQAAGAEGLGFLVSKVMKDEAKASPNLSFALHSFGDTGFEAVQAALTTSDPVARERLTHLIAPIAGSRYLEPLTAIAFSRLDTETAKGEALAKLRREWQTVPGIASVQASFRKSLDKHLNALREATGVDVPMMKEVWGLQKNGTLAATMQDEKRLELERCYQRALHVLRLESTQDELATIAYATVLEHQYVNVPNVFLEDPWEGTRSVLPSDFLAKPEFLSRLWDAALKNQLPGAQLRCAQAFEDNPGLFLSSTGLLDRVSNALSSGFPAVRYAAAQSLAKRLLAGSFPASTRASETMMEMLSLEAEPTALILGSNDGLCDHASLLLKQLGQRTVSLSSGRSALRWLEEPNPVESIFIVDHVADISLSQLVQRIRSHPRGSKVTIAILLEDVSDRQHNALSEVSGVVYSSVPSQIDGMLHVLRMIEQVDVAPKILPADRIGWRSAAEQFVRQAAELPSEKRTQILDRWTHIISSKVEGSLLSDASLETLSQMGNRASQSELAARATRWNLDSNTRQEAARELIESYRKHGIQQSVDEIQFLYDTYNQKGRTDKDVRKYLGEVLDAIDKRSGK